MGRRKKMREKSDREELQDWLKHLGNRAYSLDLLAKAKGQLVCTDEEYSYYSVTVEGFSLMYRKRTQRTDGRKMYRLTEPLARMMGFDSFDSMRYLITSIQYWRGWISPQRLTEALVKYISVMNRCRY